MSIMRRVPLALGLVAAWILLWGSASVANVLSGLLVVAGLFAMYPMEKPVGPRRLRPVGFAVLAVTYLGSMISATAVVVAAVFGPRTRVRSGLIEVRLALDDPVFITMVSNLTALTPGSMVVHMVRDGARPVVWVHILTLGDPARLVEATRILELRCVRAFGSDEQIALAEERTEDLR